MHRPLDVDFKSEVPFANASFEKPPEIRRLNAAKFSLYARAHPNSNYNHQFLIISFIISSYRIPMLILIPKKKKKKKKLLLALPTMNGNPLEGLTGATMPLTPFLLHKRVTANSRSSIGVITTRDAEN